MYRTCISVYILTLFIGYWCSDDFRQEQAKVTYSNPKYIADVVVFTGRKSRHEPYLTNMTATLLMAYGNNVTDDFRQEQAKVTYSNLKYIADVVVFKGRKSRAVFIHFKLTMTLKSGGDFHFQSGACDSVKYKWMHQFMSTYTNLTLTDCPFPPARYSYYNMELPPKNIPLPIADGDYAMDYQLSITATKEPILTIRTLLHYDKSKKNSKKNKKGKH